MSLDPPRRRRAGETVEDLCRACKTLRRHTVMAVDGDGTIRRVVCDYCKSQHNYRGGARTRATGSARPGAPAAQNEPLAPVGERERSHPVMTIEAQGGGTADLEMLLRRIIREETGLTPVVPADKWRGGELVLRPGRDGVQEKSWPIEAFFNKIVMLRNRLRVLEQQINGAEFPVETKLKLQGYVTACYGTLTSFNVLFADEQDRFRGASGKD